MLIDNKSVDGVPIDQLTKGSEKKVRTQCDKCGKESLVQWSNYLRSQSKRNNSGETFCRACSSRLTGKKRKGCTFKKKPDQIKRGSEHPSWKGGKYTSNEGYVMINIRAGDPKEPGEIGWKRYKKEHHIVMEDHLGRPLNKNEHVHHINGIKTDNRIENLFLVQNNSEHMSVHKSLQELGYLLYRNNLISFNEEKLVYVAVDKLRELLERP